MRITFLRGECAELAREHTDVRVIDVTIEDVGGDVAVFLLPHRARHDAEGVQVVRLIKLQRVLLGNPFVLRNLLSDRISEQDALQLYQSNDLNSLGIMASAVRKQKNGNVATYILNRYINYSNICVLSCQFCAFAAKKRDAHAFENSADEIVAAVKEAL